MCKLDRSCYSELHCSVNVFRHAISAVCHAENIVLFVRLVSQGKSDAGKHGSHVFDSAVN